MFQCVFYVHVCICLIMWSGNLRQIATKSKESFSLGFRLDKRINRCERFGWICVIFDSKCSTILKNGFLHPVCGAKGCKVWNWHRPEVVSIWCQVSASFGWQELHYPSTLAHHMTMSRTSHTCFLLLLIHPPIWLLFSVCPFVIFSIASNFDCV